MLIIIKMNDHSLVAIANKIKTAFSQKLSVVPKEQFSGIYWSQRDVHVVFTSKEL